MDLLVGVEIDGYNFVYKNCFVKLGGGVGLYVLDNFDFRICIDIYVDEVEVMEVLFIDIIWFYEKNSIVGIIYCFLN